MILAGDIGGTQTTLALFAATAGPWRLRRDSRPHFSRRDSTATPRSSRATTAATSPVRRHPAATSRASPAAGSWPLASASPGRCGRTAARRRTCPGRSTAPALARLLGLAELSLLNDLEAIGYGIDLLRPHEIYELQAGEPGAAGNRAVIAAGTGLGEAGLFWDGAAHRPFATEGGHADFAPQDELQIALLRFLRQEHEHVSWERVVSGPGLVSIYRFLLALAARWRAGGSVQEPPGMAERLQADEPAAWIWQCAASGESPLCGQAVDLFLRLYGAEAGNLALKTMATGGSTSAAASRRRSSTGCGGAPSSRPFAPRAACVRCSRRCRFASSSIRRPPCSARRAIRQWNDLERPLVKVQPGVRERASDEEAVGGFGGRQEALGAGRTSGSGGGRRTRRARRGAAAGRTARPCEQRPRPGQAPGRRRAASLRIGRDRPRAPRSSRAVGGEADSAAAPARPPTAGPQSAGVVAVAPQQELHHAVAEVADAVEEHDGAGFGAWRALAAHRPPLVADRARHHKSVLRRRDYSRWRSISTSLTLDRTSSSSKADSCSRFEHDVLAVLDVDPVVLLVELLAQSRADGAGDPVLALSPRDGDLDLDRRLPIGSDPKDQRTVGRGALPDLDSPEPGRAREERRAGEEQQGEGEQRNCPRTHRGELPSRRAHTVRL